ncbi:hypothetical protein MKX01_034747 [Papaver californicum]|nr:hypothetical protein MKX01_034747 [Papaver californicum]
MFLYGAFAGKLEPKAAEGNNRRALGDIGYLVTKRGGGDAGKHQQFNVHATKGFDKCGCKRGKKETPNTQKSSRKKKVQTLTSVLSARSKVACGLSDKEKEIVDIDAGDIDNQLVVMEYVEDLYKLVEVDLFNSIQIHDYMYSKNQINAKMMMILIDWLIQVHKKFELSLETLYLTIYIVDRYLSIHVTQRKKLQLIGISSMLIASKYEEIWAPEINFTILVLVKNAPSTVNKRLHLYLEEKKKTENIIKKSILAKLGWTLIVPTPYVFLVRFVKAVMANKKMEAMTFFLAELGLMQYAVVMFRPSMFAASAVYAARCTLNKTQLWDKTLEIHTDEVVFNKYSSHECSIFALLAPSKSLWDS